MAHNVVLAPPAQSCGLGDKCPQPGEVVPSQGDMGNPLLEYPIMMDRAPIGGARSPTHCDTCCSHTERLKRPPPMCDSILASAKSAIKLFPVDWPSMGQG